MTIRLVFTTALLALTSCQAETPAVDSAAKAWAQVPQILRRIVPPKFPARDFPVVKYGAVGDGTNDCTAAFAAAIKACHEAGGGRVVVPPGKYLTGAIHLLSNVNLHVEKGATILFSTDPKKFLPLVLGRDVAEMMNYSPFIYAFEQENIAVTGEGTLDGQTSKSVWQNWVGKDKSGVSGETLTAMGDKELPVAERIMGEKHFIRPNFIVPFRCKNILIQGVRIVDSPMWEIQPVYCTNLSVIGVSISSHGKNNDGCDPDSCRDVLIKNCVFDTGDDCIAVKAGRDHDGRRVNLPSENIVIQNCTFKDGHGGVTLGSETSGGIQNVFAENCHFDSPNMENALRFKSNPARGGFIRNIYIRNCDVKLAKVGIHMTLRYTASGTKEGEFLPEVRDIDIRDCKFGRLLKQAVFIEGLPGDQISDVTIANCDFAPENNSVTVTNAVRVNFVGNRGLKTD